jgi:predicted transposase YbfD/YdcC
MVKTAGEGLDVYFAELVDPRVERTKCHKLLDIVVIAILGVICGAEGWTDLEAFGEARLEWLQSFLELPNGIPSHDTFGRVFARLDPAQFARCFASWMQAVKQVTRGKVIAIDGKCLRHSFDGALGKAALHMVSAWATANHLVLGQQRVDSKSNEITAIPALLEQLAVQGCIVTVDAMGCQKEIASRIVAQGGDYVLALKENQPHLHEDVVSLFIWADNVGFEGIAHELAETTNASHGRIEVRHCWTISDPQCLEMIADHSEWCGLRTVIRVEARRTQGTQTSVETRYYISSLPDSVDDLAQRALESVRSHWDIENGLHWILDVVFREDDSRIRTGHAPENFAWLRRMALTLLRNETSQRKSVRAKRLRAGWDTDYLLKVLAF